MNYEPMTEDYWTVDGSKIVTYAGRCAQNLHVESRVGMWVFNMGFRGVGGMSQ